MKMTKSTFQQIGQLFLGVFLIWLFIFKITPLLTSRGMPAQMINYVNENNIDATPLFYTESEKGKEAAYYLAKSRK